jgi:GntR family transcriptional regulator, transcriptional repressor for pyruvate dehydrogenase complex
MVSRSDLSAERPYTAQVTKPGATPAATRAGGKGDLLTRVSIGRISEVIVDQIRLLIRGGELSAGDRLPSERELCERFGVSRVTVREALRVLEANGLVEIRVGARGGAFVTAPSSRLVGEGIADLITLSAMSAVDVTEARMVLELGIMPLVCERATEEDVAALYEICDRSSAALENDEFPLALSAEWHARYAQSAHNAAVAMLVESLHDPLIMSLERARKAAPLHGRRGVDEHRALVEAIGDRDAERATKLMKTHLERTAERIAATGESEPRPASSAGGRKRAAAKGTRTRKPAAKSTELG